MKVKMYPWAEKADAILKTGICLYDEIKLFIVPFDEQRSKENLELQKQEKLDMAVDEAFLHRRRQPSNIINKTFFSY
jgi:hypothetical protein